ncbi:MAG: hypothetical protein HZB46_05180 [Solirubrobacterales bacterium]|nr:hypothetical protein [Solirubrobacterales bacterium]
MLPANLYVVCLASEADEPTLRRLAEVDAKAPIVRPALIGEIGGVPAAALSLADGCLAADPFQPTAHLAAHLRMRAYAISHHERTPSLRERLLAAVRVPRPAQAYN